MGKILIALALLLFTLHLIFFTNFDSTDKGLRRSGLGLYIDNATGCHYVKAGLCGTLVPRLDKNGDIICGGWEYEKKLKKGTK